MQYPTTLHADTYRRLKAMIVGQELPCGTKLVLRNLAKQLGTSTMPVLEAIRRLEHDGLVTQIPKWGAFVKEWTEHEQMEALHIRRALEGEAARLFVTRASAKRKDELVLLNVAFDKAAAEDVLAGLDADVALHLHIATSTGFSRLTQLIEVAKLPLAMIMKTSQSGSAVTLNKVGCHTRLVRALLNNDPDLACRAMWEHVDGTIGLVSADLVEGDIKGICVLRPAGSNHSALGRRGL
jgi:DNA-binding GntR family transcriptional regulator